MINDSLLSDGSAVVWTVVPYRYELSIDDAEYDVDGHLFVVKDGSDWHALRTDGAWGIWPQARFVYPFLRFVP